MAVISVVASRQIFHTLVLRIFLDSFEVTFQHFALVLQSGLLFSVANVCSLWPLRSSMCAKWFATARNKLANLILRFHLGKGCVPKLLNFTTRCRNRKSTVPQLNLRKQIKISDQKAVYRKRQFWAILSGCYDWWDKSNVPRAQKVEHILYKISY